MEIKAKYITATSPGLKYSDGWSWYHNPTGCAGFKLAEHRDKAIVKDFLAKYGSDERLNTTDTASEDLKACCREMMNYL